MPLNIPAPLQATGQQIARTVNNTIQSKAAFTQTTDVLRKSSHATVGWLANKGVPVTSRDLLTVCRKPENIKAGLAFAGTFAATHALFFALGFGPQGPMAGYLSPVIQSWYGSVPKGSAFALMQSAGAKGVLWAAASKVGAGGGAVVGALVRKVGR